MVELLASKGKLCTGCGACYNVCPKDAIRMEPNEEGFLVPRIQKALCVNCGLCEKTCPVLNPVYKNTEQPDCYALRASDEIREKSSSGGTFTLLANEILGRGGVVFGAAWTKEWTVAHIGIEDAEHLALLRSSKYLQSDTGKSFTEVKEHLRKGRPVLYTGCPCEIAGLYAFLGTSVSLDKLYTAEIICHGAPSPKAFQKYLNDNFDVPNIERFDFRDKSVYHWITSCNVWFKDGTQLHRSEKQDPYLQAFLPCMSMRPSCSVCPFSKMPRQADISMGDYWGIERFDKTWNDHKGTSLVLVNSAKGQELFDRIKEKSEMVQTPLEYATHINKTIMYPFRAHPGRKHFYSALDKKEFNSLVKDSLNHHYDIGIVGLWYGINYGSVLTYYALYEVLQNLGYDVVLLPKPNRMWEERFNAPESIAQRFIWPRCNVFLPLQTQEQFTEMNDHCTDFMLGSDVVWNYDVCGKQADMFFFLDWVECGHRKIAYAASFGQKLSGTEQHIHCAQHYLKKFDAISVREDSGAAAIQKECGRTDAAHVLDPVFLCPREVYDKAADSVQVPSGVFAYILRFDNNPGDVLQKLEYVEKAKNEALYICGNPNAMTKAKNRYKERLLHELSVEEWIAYIKNSVYVVGDSYHAVCFSLIYHKPFVAVYESSNRGFAIERFRSLLRLVGLEDRLLTSWKDTEKFKEIVAKPIDWDDVDKRLAQQKIFSEKWLREALQKKLPEYTEQDYLEDHQRRLRCQDSLERNDIRIQLEELRRKTDRDKVEFQNKLDELRSSPSWRIGRAITWLPRKIRGGYRCVKENGWKYTIRHLGEKINGKLHL